MAVHVDPAGVEEEESKEEDNGEEDDDDKESAAADFKVTVVELVEVPSERWLRVLMS